MRLITSTEGLLCFLRCVSRDLRRATARRSLFAFDHISCYFFSFPLTHLYSLFALPQISGVDFAGLKGHTQGACLGPPWDEGAVFHRPFPVSLNAFPPLWTLC